MRIGVFWEVTVHSWVSASGCLEGAYCLYHQWVRDWDCHAKSDTVSHSKRHESSKKWLWKPQIFHTEIVSQQFQRIINDQL